MSITNATTMRAKATNYEGRFFGMILLAWVGLAIVFNVLHRQLPPQPEKPAPGVAASAVMYDAQSATPNAGKTARSGRSDYQ
jgi:hypothetical protein